MTAAGNITRTKQYNYITHNPLEG